MIYPVIDISNFNPYTKVNSISKKGVLRVKLKLYNIKISRLIIENNIQNIAIRNMYIIRLFTIICIIIFNIKTGLINCQ
jgi:hypothetical protein